MFSLIIQEFYWNENKILTLCHENIGETIGGRRLEESIKISNNTVVFKEFDGECEDFESIDWNLVINGFLDCNNEKNPYGNYCTLYKEFVNQYNNGIDLNNDDFEKLYDFVKEFSNYSITHNAFGNIIVFTPIKISVESHNSESFPYLLVSGNDVKGMAFVKFKVNDIILESYIINDISDGEVISSQGDWNNFEIEIYDGLTLIYKAKYDIIRSINLNMKTVTNVTKKQLRGYDTEILIKEGVENSFAITDGTVLDSISSYLNTQSIDIKKIKKSENLCKFLRKNEREKAFEIFKELVELPGKLWIFDPYAISDDNGGIDGLINIVSILCTSSNPKYIVFCETNGITFDRFKRGLTQNANDSFRGLKLENLNFIKAKEHFHDRFIFLENDKTITGYQLGTSLNSYGDNYSNIVKLDLSCSEEIFQILKEDIVSEDTFKLVGE